MCPRCQSNVLLIRNAVGFERILILLTGKRQFWCQRCSFGFRAPDRRKRPRPAGIPSALPKVG
jgi:hypothetical protein